MQFNTQCGTDISSALAWIKQGELIGMPTETVYGLAADARNKKAVHCIYELKQRPLNHPVIIHITKDHPLEEWATDIPVVAYRLIEHFWPGPLTLILKRHPSIGDYLTGGQETIALRSPAHPLTYKLLEAFQGGLAAPSANRFTQLSPTSTHHVLTTFQGEIPYILEGGECNIGLESTILDITTRPLQILRPGFITSQDLQNYLDETVSYAILPTHRAPGLLPKHYCPRTSLHLIHSEAFMKTIELFEKKQQSILAMHYSKFTLPPFVESFLMPPDAKSYGQLLYTYLHRADRLDKQIILVEEPPHQESWHAVLDRLQRASTPI